MLWRLVAIEVTVTRLDMNEIGFFLLPLLIESAPPSPPAQQRDGSYKIWQLQEELLINLECSSDLHRGEVMAGEEKKKKNQQQKKAEWLLPFNLYLSCSFSFSSLVSLFSLTFASSVPLAISAYRLLQLLLFSPLFAGSSCLTISWHAHREHRSSPQFLLPLPCAHPSPHSSPSHFISPSPCVTISRQALREFDEYFSSQREGLQASSSFASTATNGPESLFSFE